MDPMIVELPLLEESSFSPPLYRCGDGSKPISESHIDGMPCSRCRLIRDPEKTERMRTLTKTQYELLQFIYWNPDSGLADFELANLLRSTDEECLLEAIDRLVERGLLVAQQSEGANPCWSTTDQAVDYLDPD